MPLYSTNVCIIYTSIQKKANFCIENTKNHYDHLSTQ